METDTYDTIMPKGRTRHQGNMGGQRRVFESTCGWGCSGHPSEVIKKFERHKKFCNVCKGMIMPKYDPVTAGYNGWRETDAYGRPDNRMVTAVVEGVPMNFAVKGERTTDNVLKKAEEIINPTRSLCNNCHQLPVAPNRKCFDDWCERCDEALYSTKDIEVIV